MCAVWPEVFGGKRDPLSFLVTWGTLEVGQRKEREPLTSRAEAVGVTAGTERGARTRPTSPWNWKGRIDAMDAWPKMWLLVVGAGVSDRDDDNEGSGACAGVSRTVPQGPRPCGASSETDWAEGMGSSSGSVGSAEKIQVPQGPRACGGAEGAGPATDVGERVSQLEPLLDVEGRWRRGPRFCDGGGKASSPRPSLVCVGAWSRARDGLRRSSLSERGVLSSVGLGPRARDEEVCTRRRLRFWERAGQASSWGDADPSSDSSSGVPETAEVGSGVRCLP